MPEQTSSPLLKIARLVNGDDLFRMRVETACALTGQDFTPDLLLRVAATPDVNGAASVDVEGTVDSSTIPDEAITAAVAAYTPKN